MWGYGDGVGSEVVGDTDGDAVGAGSEVVGEVVGSGVAGDMDDEVQSPTCLVALMARWWVPIVGNADGRMVGSKGGWRHRW